MELSEAKKNLEKTIQSMNEDKEEWYILRTEEWKERCETLLKALDNKDRTIKLLIGDLQSE